MNDKKEIVVTNQNQAITPMDMLQTAISKGADLAQLEKFMDLADRWQKDESRKAYISAMNQFRANCPTISRTKKAHNSNYAGLAETLDEIKDLLSECGLSHSWKTDQNDGVIKVTCCVTHVQGHQECTSLSEGADTSGSKNKIQGMGSTVSYLQRYTLFAILGLASKEMDNDGGAPVEYIGEDLVNTIHAKLTENEIDLAQFKNWLKRDLKADSIEHIPLKSYNIVNRRIDQKIAAMKKEGEK